MFMIGEFANLKTKIISLEERLLIYKQSSTKHKPMNHLKSNKMSPRKTHKYGLNLMINPTNQINPIDNKSLKMFDLFVFYTELIKYHHYPVRP